jgi:PAS domain S-box-containing protein
MADRGDRGVTALPTRFGRLLVPGLVLGVVYALTAKVGLTLAFAHPSATAVWPPTGIALAACLMYGYGLWPAIFVAAFLVNLTTPGSVATSTGIAVGNTLEVILGCYLVTRFAGGRAAFERPEDTLRFAALAGLLSTSVSATLGVTSLALGGYAEWAQSGMIWLTWWLGNVGGVLIVAPFLLLWGVQARIDSSWSFGKRVLLAYLLVIVVGATIFAGWVPLSVNHYPIEFLPIPVLAWFAFRLGRRVTATAVVLLSAIAIWGTLRGFGPFAGETPNVALVLLQAYMSVVAVTALTLAVAAVDRARVGRVLEEHIADHQQARDALRVESRFRALLESAPDAMVITDAQGKIVLVNSRTETLFGHSRDQLVGQAIELLVPDHVRPSDTMQPVDTGAVASSRVVWASPDLQGRRCDESEFPVEISMNPIEIEGERFVSTAIRDVSERKRVDQTVRHLAALVEASNDAIFSKRLDGTIASWNRGAERLFGYTAEEVEGQPQVVLSPPGQEAELRELLACLARGETIDAYETTRKRKDGQLVEVSITMSPIRDASGRITAGSVVARDITEKKRTEQALREINHELETFASTVSHDLRAPLRQLAGLADVLVEDYGDALDDTGRRYARRLASVASRMDALTQRLLDYSRVSREALPLAPVGLGAIVADACSHLDEEIRSRHARVEISPKLPHVLAHDVTLAHVVGNLLSNAIKFVNPDVRPTVRVWAEERGDWARLWVEDNGLGIEPRFHEKIFHPFERLQGIDAYAGTGLGLAIVRKGVERMGGRAGVESEAQRGSRFWVELKKERE